MITRKQLVALVAFVLVGAVIIFIGRDEPPKNVERNQSTQTTTSTQSNESAPGTANSDAANSNANPDATNSNATNPNTNPDTTNAESTNPTDTNRGAANPRVAQPAAIHPATIKAPAIKTGATKPAPPANSGAADFEFPAGPSRELFLSKCTVCHSLRNISKQRDFSKAYWDKEVAKMVDVYHAHITQSDAEEIVRYLSSIKK